MADFTICLANACGNLYGVKEYTASQDLSTIWWCNFCSRVAKQKLLAKCFFVSHAVLNSCAIMLTAKKMLALRR